MNAPLLASLALALAASTATLFAADTAPASPLRATEFTVTVGPEGSSAQIKGSDSFALQKAADTLAARAPEGRGCLQILPGTYTMHDSLHVRVPMLIRGQPGKTILQKPAQFITTLTDPAPVDTVELHVKDATGLKVGYGITLRPEKERAAWNPVMRTITAITGNTLRIDRPPASEAVYGRPSRTYAAGSVVQTTYPLIAVRNVDDVEIEDLILDGNLDQNKDTYIDGCRNGGLYFTGGKDHAVRRVEVHHYNGDGISWQTVHNVTVENCTSHHNAGFGFHPGTGSRYTVVRNCHAHHNGDIGLFVCWNVKFARFENNLLEDNANHGITIGHNDTDNLFLNNTIRRNGKSGISFRNDGPPPSRCTYRGNTIEDNGTPPSPATAPAAPPAGVGIAMPYPVQDITLDANTIRDTRPDGQKTQLTALSAGPKVTHLTLTPANKFEGKVQLPKGQFPAAATQP